MRLLKIALVYWLCFGLLLGLAGLLFFPLLSSGHPDEPLATWNLIRWPIGIALACFSGASLILALRYTSLLVDFLTDAHGPNDQFIEWLDSPIPWQKRKAVETVGHLLGHPFGPVCPAACEDEQIDTLASLYKLWFRMKLDLYPAATSDQTTACVREALKHLAEVRLHQNERVQDPEAASEAIDPSQPMSAVARIYPPLPPPPAPVNELAARLAQTVRGDKPNPIERLAEVVKDVMIDWDFLGEEDDGEEIIDDLPPMSADAFILRLRIKMEQTLRRVADAVNEAPTGDIIAASEEKVCDHLAELVSTAVVLGVQMRLEEADARLPPGQRVQGEWARRLRRMLAGGAAMPVGASGVQKS